MPQPAQHSSLIHVLLLWITILSIIQAVFITLFFTAGHHGLSQNSSAVTPERTMPIHSPSQSPSEQELLLGKGKMLTFQATEASNTIKWLSKNPSKGLVSEEGDVLTIMKDGYYFLNLQVTLKTSSSERHRVILKWNSKDLMQGSININTSTCLLAKVEELFAGGKLVVTIEPPTTNINKTESFTHLDIIYMVKP